MLSLDSRTTLPQTMKITMSLSLSRYYATNTSQYYLVLLNNIYVKNRYHKPINHVNQKM